MGRPKGSSPLLNPERTQAICGLLESGVPEKYAAEANDVDEVTFHGWMKKGLDGTEPYAGFRKAVTRARARGAINLHTRVLNGGKGCMGAQFALERRFRDEYGPRQRIEHAGHDGGSVKIETTEISKMSDEELLKLAQDGQG